MTFGLEGPFQAPLPTSGQSLDNSPPDELLFSLGQLTFQSLQAELDVLMKRFPSIGRRIVLAIGAQQVMNGTGSSDGVHRPILTDGGGMLLARMQCVRSTDLSLNEPRLSGNNRLEIGGLVPDAPWSVVHFPATATTATCQHVTPAGKRAVVWGMIQYACTNVQANIAQQLDDSVDGAAIWKVAIAAAATSTIRVPVPPRVCGVAATITLTAAAPAAGNQAAAYLQGYDVTP